MLNKFNVGDLVAPIKEYEEFTTWRGSSCGIILSGPTNLNGQQFYFAFFDEEHANVAIQHDMYEKVGQE